MGIFDKQPSANQQGGDHRSDTDGKGQDSTTETKANGDTTRTEKGAEVTRNVGGHKVLDDRGPAVDGDDFSESGDVANESNARGTMWSSHPVMRFKLGRFQFENGLLTLKDSDDISEFEKLLDGLKKGAPRDANRIKKLDPDAAAALVNVPEPSISKQFDSSVGRARDTIAGEKLIGDEALDADSPEGARQGEKFAKVAQTDGNKPVAGTPAQNVANELNQGDTDTEQRGESE